MKVTREEAGRIADLARLKFTDEELEKIAGDMTEVLGYVAELEKVNTGDAKITVNPIYMENRLRDDEVNGEMPSEKFLMNVPQRVEDYLKVPRLLGGEESDN